MRPSHTFRVIPSLPAKLERLRADMKYTFENMGRIVEELQKIGEEMQQLGAMIKRMWSGLDMMAQRVSIV